MSSRGKEVDKRVFREEYAYVLDFLPNGNPFDTHHPSHRVRPIAQALGDKYFTLIEFHTKPGVYLVQGEKVYVGFTRKELRDKVEYVWGGAVLYDELTSMAKGYLPEAIKKIVVEKERVFVDFFNIAEPVTIKLHALELLPGIGKKTMWLILEERKKKPFESFNDIQQRTKIVDPMKLIIDRILLEIQGKERYYLFLDPPPSTEKALILSYLRKLYERAGMTYV